MCGIFGVAGHHPPLELEAHARRLTHRGPDGFGSWTDEALGVYLAHCRLSIIDLSPRAAQPMTNEDGSVLLTFNGEIYNFKSLRAELRRFGHSFKSESDSEVIVHAYEQWGQEFLAHLDGMFALAIWDATNRRLLLARDRIGIKPLYFMRIGDGIAFASEPKALLGLDATWPGLHEPALISYLLHRYVAGSESIWEGVSRLLPAHALTYELATKTVRMFRYWEPELVTREWTTAAATDRLEFLLMESVDQCLVSDVPIGVFLSGGYDSSLVAACAARSKHDVETYCVGFEGHSVDERPIARQTAVQLGTTHRETSINQPEFESALKVFDLMDEPLGDSSLFPTNLVCRTVRQRATVALSGDGGDELFAGYRWYVDVENVRPLKSFAFSLYPVLQALGMGEWEVGRRSNRLEHFRRMSNPAFTLKEIRRLFPTLAVDAMPEDENYLYKSYYRSELKGVKRWQYIDLMTFLPDSNLTKTDRVSMANSLEVRVPFLDHRLVDFAFSLPENLRLRGRARKYLLSKLLTRFGLSHLLNVPKQGFSSPIHSYWSAESMIRSLRTGELVRAGLLDSAALRGLAESSDPSTARKLWLLEVLEMWFLRWIASPAYLR